MKRYGVGVLMLSLLLFVVANGSAFAQANHDALNVHVYQEVAIPGGVLSPGDYTFRLVDRAGGSQLLEIASADGSEMYGFFFMIPASRESTRSAEAEIEVGHPGNEGLGVVREFFFPGESHGYAFVYSKKQLQKAEMMARTNGAKTSTGF